MIFGFNTDVKHGDTIYHVQSEARKADLLLQTMVFVQGHCIGKYASSYAEQVGNPGFSEEHIHSLLKNQHREVIDVVKAGSVDQFFRGQLNLSELDRTVRDPVVFVRATHGERSVTRKYRLKAEGSC